MSRARGKECIASELDRPFSRLSKTIIHRVFITPIRSNGRSIIDCLGGKSVRPHPVWQLELPDGVTIANVILGFLAIITVSVASGSGVGLGVELGVGMDLAARLVLLGAIADGLDGVLARMGSSSAVGALLDSLADIVSFGVAPALFVFGVARVEWELIAIPGVTPRFVLTVLVTAVFVVTALLRTTVYMVYDSEEFRAGVPNTLAATILAVTYLAGFDSPALLLAEAAVLSYLMLAQIPYPGLCARDAFGIGAVQAAVVVVPEPFSRWLARVLLVVALAYLVLGPISYRNRGIRK